MLKKAFRKILIFPKWLLYILVVLILIRIALPVAGKYAVNWYLGNRITPYIGHIEDFDLSLIRGSYEFEEFVIEKQREDNSKKLDPLFKADEIEVSLAWRAIFKGKVLGDLKIDEAEIVFLDSQSKDGSQSGADKDWKEVFVTLIPIDIEDLKIHDSSIAFKNYDFKKPINVYISDIELHASNINNTERKNKAIFSDLDLKAKILDKAPITVNGAFDILAKIPAYDLSMTVKDFDISEINPLLLVYGPLSFTSGTVNVYSEMATKDTRVDGYVKAFFKRLDVVAPTEKFISIKHFFYEIAAAVGNLLLRSSDKKEVAFRVPIDGPITNLSVSITDAFKSALKNAFTDDKLTEGLEKSISLKNVAKGKKPEASPAEKAKIKELTSDPKEKK